MKRYIYNFDGNIGSVDFSLSDDNRIDSSVHTLFDLNQDEIKFLTFDQRFEITNSWLDDNTARNMSLDRPILVGGCNTVVKVKNGKTGKIIEMLNFTSNDYLNLSQHPKVIELTREALNNCGAGAGASPAILGTSDYMIELEKEIAEHKGCESALIQPSGFVTNIGVIKTLLRSTDVAVYDMYSHASLIEGTISTDIFKVFFKHNDVEHLEYLLKRTKNKYSNCLVIVEGIYSMDGDIAPLDKIVEVCKKYGANILVDDAHGTGVIGKTGKGTIEHYGLEGKIDIVTGTFSKALGSVGGFVAGSRKLIEYLRISNKAYFCSTAPFISSLAASLAAMKVIDNEPNILRKLWDNINYFKSGLSKIGFNTDLFESPIIPLIVKTETNALALGEVLREKGIIVLPVFYPVVPKDKARIRLSLSAGHTKEHLDFVLKALKDNIRFFDL